ncbi:outer membrane beta-barrel protein [Mucilaginibacter sp. dw_454]|uniref:outer membrane beta-barrel protein n=1 Tax=Mucilaginibacter sp. dw_454 TaxID=2720079 RepID=UPI001BD62AC7|nr:outer membrane beta-barrel protein [Mucilaginibacter sp. dw_454]
MKIFKTVLLAVWICFAFNFAQAQTTGIKISGAVTDISNKPIDGATVNLLTTKDSVVVKSLVCDANGKFTFEDIKTGTYQLRVTTVGFKNYKSANFSVDNKSIILPAIQLQSTSTSLKEVAVTGQKDFVEQKIDRTVVNVNALISNTGSNALEVLQKTPGVQVDVDGNITFKGKSGVLIMIDDKPTYLSAANLATYLRSLPSSSLDKIELMDNPPAKYDAAGTAGVINIKTKKNTIRGFNASFSSSYGVGFYGRLRESLNLNYRVDKVNLFANLSYNYNNNYRKLEIDRNYLHPDGSPDFSFKDISIFRPAENDYNAKVGADFFISPKTTWGVVLTGGLSNGKDNSPVYSSFYNVGGGLDSTINTQNISHNKFNSGGINLNYSHKYDTTGTALTFDLDYIRDIAGANQTFINNTIATDGTLLSSQTIANNLPGAVNIYAAKVDFVKALKNDGKFEAGIKSSYVNTDDAANYFNVVNGVSTINYDNTNHFLYKENINAAYVNYNQNWKRFGIQAGLRAENTNGNGHQLGNAQRPDSSFVNHYTNFFPTAYLSYKLDTAGHNTLGGSYGRRIDRAGYGQLNPFIEIIDKFTQFRGNPFLRPTFTDTYKIQYSYKSLLSVALLYNYATDVQNETIFQDGNIFVSTPGNIGYQKNFNLSANFNLHPTKWWTANIYADETHNSYKGVLATGIIDQSGYTFSANANNQFTIGKGWSAELSGFFRTGGVYGQFRSIPTGMVNSGLQKKILNNKGSLKLAINDMFKTFSPSGTITSINNSEVTYHNLIDTRVSTLTFTYNFGKTLNNPPKRQVGSADDEQGRAH